MSYIDKHENTRKNNDTQIIITGEKKELQLLN